jgi:hypothetical protein
MYACHVNVLFAVKFLQLVELICAVLCMRSERMRDVCASSIDLQVVCWMLSKLSACNNPSPIVRFSVQFEPPQYHVEHALHDSQSSRCMQTQLEKVRARWFDFVLCGVCIQSLTCSTIQRQQRFMHFIRNCIMLIAARMIVCCMP